jgi:peptide-methionine (S)-S-oxide reductase
MRTAIDLRLVVLDDGPRLLRLAPLPMFAAKSTKLRMPTAAEALPGRADPMQVPEVPFVHGRRLVPPFPDGHRLAMFGLGCFWGAERKFWTIDGVYTTMVGYAGGLTPNPTYREVCSGGTGHNEVVQLVYDPSVVDYGALLKTFWESHDPTQGMRQGNDVGTQYRSGIYAASAQQRTQAAGGLVLAQRVDGRREGVDRPLLVVGQLSSRLLESDAALAP